jgi:hypothetical protein
MSKKPPLNEEQSREQLLGWARQYGCEEALLKIFRRYDDLLRGCKTKEERKAIAAMGLLEIHNFFSGGGGTLSADGMIIKQG